MKGVSPVLSILLLVLLVVGSAGGYLVYVTGIQGSLSNQYEKNIIYPENPPQALNLICYPGYGYVDVINNTVGGLVGTVNYFVKVGDITLTGQRTVNFTDYGRIYFGLPSNVGGKVKVELYTPDWRIGDFCTVREDTGLQLYLPLDESSGTTIEDNSKYDNVVSFTGASWVNGVFDSALDFDGLTDYARVNISERLYSLPIISTCLWFNATNTSSGSYQNLISRNNANSWDLLLDPTGKLYGEIRTVSGEWNSITGSTISESYVWNLACLTFNKTTMSLYLNGVLDNQTLHTNPGQLAQHTTQDILIGGDWATYGFNGSLDEVRVYDETLDSDIIYALYDVYQ